jgi:tRNA (Thr-GGU) A37 N-methylase
VDPRSLGSSQHQFTTTIFDQFKNALTKITKESESWIISYVEDSNDAP